MIFTTELIKNNLMTKQEKIKEAYGEFYDKVKNNIDDQGWCTMINESNEFVSPTCLDLGMSREYYDNNIEGGYFSDSNTHKWRPKSLHGIENNNGWIKIESEADLPKETDHYLVYNKINNGIEVDYIDHDYESHSERWVEFNSHYQPIQKPKPPIY